MNSRRTRDVTTASNHFLNVMNPSMKKTKDHASSMRSDCSAERARSSSVLLFLRRVAIISFFLLGAGSHQRLLAQVTNYTYAASSGTFTILSGATSPALSGGTVNDGQFNALPIGFDFWYNGARYTTVSASTNGWLTFGANITNSTPGNLLSSAGAPRPVIAPLWDDLDLQAAGNLSYLTSGSVGTRVFTIQWLNEQWAANASGNSISFQVKLYEGTGKVEFVYKQETGSLSSASASIGITNTAGGSGSYWSLNNASSSATASSSTATATISAKPANGQTFAFTPPVPTAPTNLTFTSVGSTSMTLNWTDNSGNEDGFVIYKSSNGGSSYAYASQTAAGVTTSAQSGLTASTTYYWKVYAVAEGGLSTALAGNQVTNSPSYTISGFVYHGITVEGMAGITMYLTGSQSSTTTTDVVGNFTFSGLTPGGNYTVTPQTYPYSFYFHHVDFVTLVADQYLSFEGSEFVSTSISGHITNSVGGAAISGVTVTLSGSESASTTTDVNGYYILSGYAGGDYVVTPSKAGYTFSPTSRTYNNPDGDQTTADFTGTIAGYNISGHIQNASATAISGVTVALSGGQTGSTTTDASGNYSFASLTPGLNFTVTPSKTNYTFSPTNRVYNALAANQTSADFTGTSTVTYTISGHIQNASAVAIVGVTVTLSGGQAGSTTTDASGNYSFAGLPSTNNYTVTPTKTNYTFSAVSLTYNNLSANQTAADFTGTSTDTYTISGHIQNASAVAIAGVTVTLSGGQAGSTTTDASGNYSFAGLPSTNNYTVTPTKTNYTFSPASLTHNNLSANQTATDFTGTSTVTYTISGHIQNASAVAISGVTVTLSGGQAGSTTTDASGNYSFAGLPSTNNYTVTPTKTNYTFSPAGLTHNNLSANQTATDFTGTSTVTYTISGHIQNASATSIVGATVTLSGGQAGSTTTDSSGNYSFAGLPSTNNYTITPTKTNYTFSPVNVPYTNLVANQAATNFTGTSTITYTISGHIQNASTVAIAGVTVTLSGGQAGSTTTDSSGNYSFAGLPSTNNYTITPTLANYTFSPVNVPYTNLVANQAATNFTGTSTITYTISGHILNASSIAISGVTVTLSGGQAGTTSTDVNGAYSFAGLPSTNNYTVTPTKTNYTFNAASLPYNALAANQTAADFTGTSTVTYTISGHIQNPSAAAIAGVTVTLSGGQTGSTTTDASGNYSFVGLPSTNNYTVTPSLTDYTFSATSLPYDNLSANQTTAHFTGTPAGYTISGHIADGASAAISGVTVTLSGGQTGTTTTDASGNYSFTSLATGLNYTVTPSKTNYAFTPASRPFNNLSADQTADFTGALIPHVTLTASVSPSGSVQPTTDLVYTISFTNDGLGSASAFVITDPIPLNTDFKVGSVTSNLGTTGLTVVLAYSSDDLGTTWTYTPVSAAGGAPPGYDRLARHVRWTFSSSLSPTSPNNSGSVTLTTRIR